MANIFNAIVRVEREGLTQAEVDKICNYLSENVAYGDSIEYYNEFDEDSGSFDVRMDVKWSLNYVKDELCEVAKKFDVEIKGRGEEEGMCFYEVIEINRSGKITRNEELSFN